MNREDYIRQYAKKYLSNEKYYEIIDESTAQEHMNKSMNKFLNYIKEPSLKLPLEDYKHLHNSNNNITCISTLSTACQKLRKNKTTTPLLPVTSTVNIKLN